jgi:hypothetical protein
LSPWPPLVKESQRVFLFFFSSSSCMEGGREKGGKREMGRESEKREMESQHKRGLNGLKAVYSVPQSGRLLTVLLIDTTHTTGARREPDWRLLPKDFTAGRRQGRRPCPPKKIAGRNGTAHFCYPTHTRAIVERVSQADRHAH